MEKPLAPAKLVHGDIAGLVLGNAAGRAAPDQRCAFIFRGLAIGDLALATLVWQRYQASREKSGHEDPGDGAVPL